MYTSCYFPALCFLVFVFLILEPLGVDFELSSSPPSPSILLLKNVDFASAAIRFSKNQGLGFKDALDGVLGLSWSRFGWFWGLLGSSCGAFVGSRWHPEFSMFLI